MSVVGSKRGSMLARTGKRQRVEKEESLLQKTPTAILLHILSFLNFYDVLIGLRLTSHYFERFIALEKGSIENFYYSYKNPSYNKSSTLFRIIKHYNISNIYVNDNQGKLTWQHLTCLQKLSPKKLSFYTNNFFLYQLFDFDFSKLERLEINIASEQIFSLLISCNKLKYLGIKYVSDFNTLMYNFLKKIKTEKLVLGITSSDEDPVNIKDLLNSLNPSVKHLKLFADSKATINQDDFKYIPDTIQTLETNFNCPLPAVSNVEILVLRNVNGNRFQKTFHNLRYWKKLKKVVCINCDLPASFYDAIGKNKSITHLSIKDDDFFAPICLAYLKRSNITHLKISRTENVSDVFGYYVDLLPKLQYLELTSDLSGNFFFRIKHNKSIKYIKIDGSIYFCNSAIRCYPPEIEEIYIKDISLIDNRIIEYLKELKNLKKITFEKCPSISNIELYRKELPSVKSITII